ncbi:SPOR domain-containing protein, partial [bacterium]|nr:SPOR domain-containing protein [bacterium]
GYFLSNTERAVTPKENSSSIQVEVKAGKQQSPLLQSDSPQKDESTKQKGLALSARFIQEELSSPKPPPDKGEKTLQPEEEQQAREREPRKFTEKRSAVYSVLVGSFIDEAQANKLRDNLQGEGYNAWVKPTFLRSKGQLWYGVRVGKFSSKKDAQAMALKLHRKERLEYKVKKEVSGE